jgi:COP9 signalosome complex subunit 5
MRTEADDTRSSKIAAEAQHGLIAQVLKDVLFSRRLGSNATASGAPIAQVVESVDATMSG